jgi:hypothetical protein
VAEVDKMRAAYKASIDPRDVGGDRRLSRQYQQPRMELIVADVLLRAPLTRSQSDRSSPTKIVTSYPFNDPAPPLESTIHPIAVAIPVAALAWFLLAIWIGFGGSETSLVVAAVSFLAVMYASLIAGGGASARDVRIGRSRRRSFSEFLEGDVEIATGSITGRQALQQIAIMPVSLVIGGSVIIAIAVLTRM